MVLYLLLWLIYELNFTIDIPYRKKHSIYRVWYFPRFQEFRWSWNVSPVNNGGLVLCIFFSVPVELGEGYHILRWWPKCLRTSRCVPLSRTPDFPYVFRNPCVFSIGQICQVWSLPDLRAGIGPQCILWDWKMSCTPILLVFLRCPGSLLDHYAQE